MGIFKPSYYNLNKPFNELKEAICREKNPKKLRYVALDKTYNDELRSIVINNLKDAEICETVLMELSEDLPLNEPKETETKRFKAASKVLSESGEISRLETIFNKCVSHRIQSVIVSYINNSEWLEKVVLDNDRDFGETYFGVKKNALKSIKDESVLARIAIQTFDESIALDATRNINMYSEKLDEVIANGSFTCARLNALIRVKEPERFAEILKEDLLLGIVSDPLNSLSEIEMLALTGDKTGRVLCREVWSNRHNEEIRYRIFPIETCEIFEADTEAIYSAMKKIIEELKDKPSENYLKDKMTSAANCIKFLHDNGIKKEQIEKELPKTIICMYNETDYSGDDYDSAYERKGSFELVFW